MGESLRLLMPEAQSLDMHGKCWLPCMHICMVVCHRPSLHACYHRQCCLTSVPGRLSGLHGVAVTEQQHWLPVSWLCCSQDT